MSDPSPSGVRHSVGRLAKAVYRCLSLDEHAVAWDHWLANAAHGGAAQISAHLRSFCAYHASVSLHVSEDQQGKWLAGAGLLSWNVPGINARFAVGIGGPSGETEHWPVLLDGMSQWCAQRRYMCLELSPHLPDTDQQAIRFLTDAGFQPAPIFAPVSSLPADLRIPLGDVTDHELLYSFRRQTRQHVTKSLDEGYQLSFPTADQEVRAAISFLHGTLLKNEVPFGPLARFTEAVRDLVRSDTGYIAIVDHSGEPLAAGVLVRCGRAHSCYRLATQRHQSLQRASYFLHWNTIRKARDEQADWYYLTGRSTSSVHQFKRGFRPQEFELIHPHRLVFRPGLMRTIETVQPIALGAARHLLGWADRLRGRR